MVASPELITVAERVGYRHFPVSVLVWRELVSRFRCKLDSSFQTDDDNRRSRCSFLDLELKNKVK